MRFAWAALLTLTACGTVPADPPAAERGYSGTVQKIFRIVRRGADLPGMSLLGKLGRTLAPAVRQNEETNQYIVRTPGGTIIAQSDAEFPVGECVRVIPEVDRAGPDFRYGDAMVVPCH